jgi:hypothetical protein
MPAGQTWGISKACAWLRLPLFTQLPRETVRKLAETVSGRCVVADIDTEIGLLRPLFSILGLHSSKP